MTMTAGVCLINMHSLNTILCRFGGSMSWGYRNLDFQTRKFMLEELAHDIAQKTLYISSRLTEIGKTMWPELLVEAFTTQDGKWLASEIVSRNLMNSHETRNKKSGGTTTVAVPITAPTTLSEGEFNRFYMRGLCLRAIADSKAYVEVYRARYSENPRVESEELVGKKLVPDELLNDLRKSIGVDTALGLPPGPNSGLSIYF